MPIGTIQQNIAAPPVNRTTNAPARPARRPGDYPGHHLTVSMDGFGLDARHPKASMFPSQLLSLVGLLTLSTAGAAQTPAGAGPGQQRAVTLDEAIRLAHQHDPAVIQAQGDSRSAAAGKRAAYASFLPTVQGGASGGRSFSEFPRVDPRTGQIVSANSTTNSINMGLNATLDIFTGFRRGATVRAAKAQESQSDAGLEAARWQSAANTSREFFNALQSTELVGVRLGGIRRAQEQLSIAIARLTTRAANIADSLTGVVRLSQARLDLLSQQSLLAQAEANLARAIGADGRVSAVSDSSVRILTTLDTAAVRAEAVGRAPGLLRAIADVRLARANLSVSKAGYYPIVQLQAATNYGGSDANPDARYKLFNNRNLGIAVQVPFFNQLQREQDVTTRGAALDAAEAKESDARREVGSKLTGLFAALEAARERIEVTRSALEAARLNGRVQLERYRLGTISIFELGQAQESLDRAEESAVVARFDYLRTKADIEALIGRAL
ncbi:MAG: TolC family protein [Gemmatimonadota bacterium]